LDTNTLVSAFLFSGTASRLVDLWQSGRITVLISKEILGEYLRVLAYPKFRLTEQEIRRLVEEELLPFIQLIMRRSLLTIFDAECSVAFYAKHGGAGGSESAPASLHYVN